MIKAQHISTHLLLLLFTIQSFLVYVVSVIYLFIQSAFPRPSITQPNRTTMTLRRQYMMVDNLRSHHNRSIRLFLTTFIFGAKTDRRQSNCSDEGLNRLMRLLSLPPLIHTVGSSHGGFSVMTLETSNFQMFCKAIPITAPSTTTATTTTTTNINNNNNNNNNTIANNERGTKSSLFYRPNGITMLLALKVYDNISSSNNNCNNNILNQQLLLREAIHYQLINNNRLSEFCDQLERYVCADSLKNKPLLILLSVCLGLSNKRGEFDIGTRAYDLLNMETMTKKTDESSGQQQQIKWNGGGCYSCPHKMIMDCVSDCVQDLILSRVNPPQKNWTVRSVCVHCGSNVYHSFDWICAHMKRDLR